MNRTRFGVMTLVMLVFFGIVAATAGSSHGERVGIRDDCDPATFNLPPPAAPGPGTCVGNGETTFPDFVAQLQAEGNAHKWRFDADNVELKRGQTLSLRSEGGEFHTFTEVKNFGGGCIPFLNGLLHLTPVPECQPVDPNAGVPVAFLTTGVPPGGSSTVTGLAPGVHHFQCLIHPWMRTTVVVRADH
ncbi:MAG: hypothetical protein QOH95_35 [Gaiellaceae bacterium]|nr:hypothetical protein [Gaiellaceae bacterium]